MELKRKKRNVRIYLRTFLYHQPSPYNAEHITDHMLYGGGKCTLPIGRDMTQSVLVLSQDTFAWGGGGIFPGLVLLICRILVLLGLGEAERRLGAIPHGMMGYDTATCEQTDMTEDIAFPQPPDTDGNDQIQI